MIGIGELIAKGRGLFATTAQGAKADAALPANADAIADVLEAAATGAPADLARIQASVSGDLTAATLSDLLALTPAIGTRSRVAGAVIVGGIPYTRWIYLVGGWRLDGEQQLFADYVPITGLAQTARQIIRSITIPAGLITRLRTMRNYAEAIKSGTTDACTATEWRLGAGSTSDAVVAASGGLVAANRKFCVDSVIIPVSATQVRYLYTGAAGYGSGTGTIQPYPINISTVDTNTTNNVLTLQMTMAGTTDIPGVAHTIIWGS